MSGMGWFGMPIAGRAAGTISHGTTGSSPNFHHRVESSTWGAAADFLLRVISSI
jgi:hypothetical protein